MELKTNGKTYNTAQAVQKARCIVCIIPKSALDQRPLKENAYIPMYVDRCHMHRLEAQDTLSCSKSNLVAGSVCILRKTNQKYPIILNLSMLSSRIKQTLSSRLCALTTRKNTLVKDFLQDYLKWESYMNQAYPTVLNKMAEQKGKTDLSWRRQEL